tara:strand:+ start:135 stop:587 length:453 start_codon:yes stop_codon:yes gene_type:complete
MIISCPSCRKKFQIDASLIPIEGRDLQCGSCDHVWFFKNIETPKKKINKDSEILKTKDIDINEKISEEDFKKKKKHLETEINEIQKRKNTFGFSQFFSLIIVLGISLIGLILILDTFKSPLSNIYPDLELLLFNLFETFKDIYLFIKDLR